MLRWTVHLVAALAMTSVAGPGLANHSLLVIPAGAVIFYDPCLVVAFATVCTNLCPPGWQELAGARGRYLVGLPGGGTLGGAAGTALANLENRPVGQHAHAVLDPGHAHTYLPPVLTSTGSGLSKAGVGDPTPTSTEKTGVSVLPAGTVEGTNAPYVQLLVCQASAGSPVWPLGAIVFFEGGSCLANYVEYPPARGRYLVGLPFGGSAGGTVGMALGDLEDRPVGTHTHAVTDPGHSHLYVPPVPASTGSGSSKAGIGDPTSTSTEAAGLSLLPAGAVPGTNAPYLQLAVCRNVGLHYFHAHAGTVLFFHSGACPADWTEMTALRGRSVVGLAPGGTNLGAMGTPLSNLENRPVGQHTHALTDPGHSHLYVPPVPTSTGSGSSKAGVGSPALTSSSTTSLTIDPAGGVGGTNAPYLQLLPCRFA